MIEVLKTYLLAVNKEFAVFAISLMPVVELRGAIPFGIGMGIHWLKVYLLSIIGNMIPVPFVILLIRPFIEWLVHCGRLSKLGSWMENHIMNKSEKVIKYKMLGLFLFVAIPFPGTGAWTGAMIAGLLDMRLKDAVPSIFCGVLVAGIIMTLISCGIKTII